MNPCFVAALILMIAVVNASCGRGDASLEDDVRSRLIVDNTTDGADLTVAVNDGTVRLGGSVRTRRQHDRALEIARDVVGPDKVVDETHVDEHPLAKAVREAIERDSALAAVPIDIDATDRGVVLLKSTQTNAEQRRRLLQISRAVPGVTGVEDLMK
jgi:osmotically-inducible protein OsmY